MREKRFIVADHSTCVFDKITKEEYVCIDREEAFLVCKRLNEQQATIDQLNLAIDDLLSHTSCDEIKKENEKLRQMIKENVFQRYREGSLADLEFKAIAYDDIVRVEMPNELEPKVIVYCKQGKKENIMSFCQMFIPFGIAYEIKEVIDDE